MLTSVEITPRRSGTEPAARHAATPGPELLPLDAGEQYRFGFDMAACIGCHSCEVACGEQNGLPATTAWRRVGEVEGGSYPTTRRYHLSMGCNHCVEPTCLAGCPTNAYEKLANGVVAHHADDCVGCQYCTWTCPYSVPVFQPDRRIVTKCDLCQPRLSEGLAPACVAACPTHAITVEKVDVAAWRADHRAANAPGMPDASTTISTTRIVVPADLPLDAVAASDWTVAPQDPHWPLIWLTLLSQTALGTSVTGSDRGELLAAAVLACAALAGAMLHLGRPVAAWKAMRNLRRSWLSREVALLSAYAALAVAAVLVPGLRLAAASVGVAGTFASAMLYMLPGRPSWNTPLTVVRFFAAAAAIGGAVGGATEVAAVGVLVSVAATGASWRRLAARRDHAGVGALHLELVRFRTATVVRAVLAVVGFALLAAEALSAAIVAIAASEVIGRWLFFVCVVPLTMPGSFWRGVGEQHR